MIEGGDDGPTDVLARVLALENAVLRAPTRDEVVRLCLELAQLRRQRLDDVEGALAALRRAVQVEPGHRLVLNRYAQLCASAERWAELVDVLELSARAARDDDERARVLAHRGDVLGKKLGRIAEARGVYREVARLARDPALGAAAREAVERIDLILEPQRGAAPRERTFVGRVRGSQEPPPSVSERPIAGDERVEQLLRVARGALEAARLGDARAAIEQALAMRPRVEAGLRLRHELLRVEGRWDELVRLLVAEGEEAASPSLAAARLGEAAELAAERLDDWVAATRALRRALAYPGQEEISVARAALLGVRLGRYGIARELRPDLEPEARAAWLEQLASAASAAGDGRAATAIRAVGFEDAVSDVGFFQARVALLEAAGDALGVEEALLRRMRRVTDPDERRAMAWELAASCEAQGRPRDAVAPLVELVVRARDDEEVAETLAAIERLAGAAHDRALYVRGLEAASQRARGEVTRWLIPWARVLRDELLDAEGARAALVRATRLGADVSQELALLGQTLEATRVPPSVDDVTEQDDPLVMGVLEPLAYVARPDATGAAEDDARRVTEPPDDEITREVEAPPLLDEEPSGEALVVGVDDDDGADRAWAIGAAEVDPSWGEAVPPSGVADVEVPEARPAEASSANIAEAPPAAEHAAAPGDTVMAGVASRRADATAGEAREAPEPARALRAEPAVSSTLAGEASSGELAGLATPDGEARSSPADEVTSTPGALAVLSTPDGEARSTPADEVISTPAALTVLSTLADEVTSTLADEVTSTLADEGTSTPADEVPSARDDEATSYDGGALAVLPTPGDEVTSTLADEITSTLADEITSTLGDEVTSAPDGEAPSQDDGARAVGALGGTLDASIAGPVAQSALVAAESAGAPGAVLTEAIAADEELEAGAGEMAPGVSDPHASSDVGADARAGPDGSVGALAGALAAPSGHTGPVAAEALPGDGARDAEGHGHPSGRLDDSGEALGGGAPAGPQEAAGVPASEDVGVAGDEARVGALSDVPRADGPLGTTSAAASAARLDDTPEAAAAETPGEAELASSSTDAPRQDAEVPARPDEASVALDPDKSPAQDTTIEAPSGSARAGDDSPLSVPTVDEVAPPRTTSVSRVRRSPHEITRELTPLPDVLLDDTGDLGAAVPQLSEETTTDGGRALPELDEITEATARRPSGLTTDAPPPEPGTPEVVAERPAEELVPAALARRIEPLADALIAGAEVSAARWLAAGVHALSASCVEVARSCLARGLDAARAEGSERAAVALVDAAWAQLDGAGSRATWAPWARPEVRPPELSSWARAARRVAELDGHSGRALAVRAAEIAHILGEVDPLPLEEAWLEVAAAADPTAAVGVSTLYERALERGDTAAARRWIIRALEAREEGARWWLRAADLELRDGQAAAAAAALERSMALAPLDVECARRLAELGVEAGQPAWLSAGLEGLLERYLWARNTGPATFVALVRCAVGGATPGDQLLAAVARERPGGAAPLDPALPEERRRLEQAFASGDVEALRQLLDPMSADGRRRLLLVLSPPFLLADLP
jgi:tetratricopeptide (TPR) repeat protein